MISKEDVAHLAQLARLKLSDEELDTLQKEISPILDYVGQVSAVSSGDETPQVPLLHNVMREDTPRAEGSPLSGKEEGLRAAFPEQKNDYNLVRKIIQKDV